MRISDWSSDVCSSDLAGDCADSGPNLTPVAANEGRIAGKNLLAGKDERAVSYPPIPSVVFTLPQLASVGFSEAVARDKGLDFDTRFDKTAGWYSSLRVGDRHTDYKVLIEKGTGPILDGRQRVVSGTRG